MDKNVHPKFGVVRKERRKGYLEYYFVLLYVCFIFPFRSSEVGNELVLERSSWRYVVCSLFLYGSALVSTVDFIKLALAIVLSDPLSMFRAALDLAELFYYPLIVFKLWRRPVELSRFLTLLSSELAGVPYRQLKCVILCIIPVGVTALVLYHHYDGLTIPKGSESWNSAAIFQLYFRIGPYLSTPYGVATEFFAFLLALTVYEVTRKYSLEIEWWKNFYGAANGHPPAMCDGETAFSHLVEVSKRLQHFFSLVNDNGSGFFLAWFAMMIPWVSFKFIEFYPNVGDIIVSGKADWEVNFAYYWTCTVLYGMTFVFCAEARRQCENIQRTITEIVLQQDPKLIYGNAVLKQVKHSLRHAGIHGGFFFQLSYQFLGSTIGLLVAYSFLVLQLRMNTNSNIGGVVT